MSTPTINDLKRLAYMRAVGASSGDMNDLERRWLIEELDLGDAGWDYMLGDLWKAFLEYITGQEGNLNDLTRIWLENAGYSGWISDMIQCFFRDNYRASFRALGPNLDRTISIDPLVGEGVATFTRADGSTDIAHVRDFENNYKLVPADEARFQGARRVRNLLPYSEDMTQNSSTWSAGNTTTANTVEFTLAIAYKYKSLSITAGTARTFKCSCWLSSSDKSQVGLRVFASASNNGESLAVYLTDTPTRYEVEVTVNTADVSLHFGLDNRAANGGDDTTSGTVTIEKLQIEEVHGQTNQAPSEYVSRDAAEGDNKVINSTFINGYNWTASNSNIIFNRGKLEVTAPPGAYSEISQTVDWAVSGRDYIVKFTVEDYESGSVLARVGTSGVGSNRSANGTYTELITGAGTMTSIAIGVSATFKGKIDNFEVYDASTGLKYFYTENNNEVVANQNYWSYDLTSWTQSNIVTTLDEVGIFGEANTATTVSDETAAARGYVNVAYTIADDSNTHTASCWIKKRATQTDEYPSFRVRLLNGGTPLDCYYQLDQTTGDTYGIVAGGTVRVNDRGDWWEVLIEAPNNGTGNTSVQMWVLGCSGNSFGSNQDSALGSCVVGHVGLMFNTTLDEYPETPLANDSGAAITNVVGTKTAQWENIPNSIENSEDLTSDCNGVVTLADTYFEGKQDQTLEDNSSTNPLVYSDGITVSDDGNWHVAKVVLRKGMSAGFSGYPAMVLQVTGGTTQNCVIAIDLDDTSSNQVTGSSGAHYGRVIDIDDDYVELHLGVKNNTSGNTTLTLLVYPSYYGSKWGYDAAAQGSITVGHVQLNKDRTIPYSANTHSYGSRLVNGIGKEKPLDYELQPVTYKAGVRMFKRFDKWAASTAYSVGDTVIPDTGSGPAGGNGYYYECVVAGTTGGSEPTFGTTIGDGTYDNGVVWKCMGKATVAGYLSEPARTNSISDSYDLTAWTQVGTSVSALDETGIDGVANHATTLTDDDGASFEYVRPSASVIANDNATHTCDVWFKKDADTSRFPAVYFELNGGTAQNIIVHLNTSTGATSVETSTGTVSHWVEDHGLWWRLVLTVTNNTSGNTNATTEVYPARSTSIGSASAAATGSCIVGHAQRELNTSVPSSPILTTGAADTRAADDLTYHSDNSLSGNFSIVASFGMPSQDAVGPTTTDYIWYNGTGSEHMYYQNGFTLSYDGTTIASSSPNTCDFVKETPSLTRLGVRNNTASDESKAVVGGDVGVSSTSALVWTAGGTVEITSFSIDRPEIVSDVVAYNTDLGTDMLEFITAYD